LGIAPGNFFTGDAVPEIEESCESCRYFQPAAHRMAHGECRRYPHSLAKLLTEWCGEFAARPQYGASPAIEVVREHASASPGSAPVFRVVP
jgi:hypothetical protein